MSHTDLKVLEAGEIKLVAETKPLLCLEVNPPRGTDIESSFSKVSAVSDHIDFFNVTDCALARMKLSGLTFGALLKKETGKEVMVNVACRDRNMIASQSDLLGAWAMGVKSIVALTGDAISVGDSPDSKGVFEVNSVGLLQAVSSLNSGKDLSGNALKGSPNFLLGAVCNPNAKNTEVEVRRLNKKISAGAKYALSQPVFDLETSHSFFSQAYSLDARLFVGLMPLKNKKALASICAVPGIKIGQDFQLQAQDKSDAELEKFSIDYALLLAKNLKNYVRGFHVIAGGYPSLANELVQELRRSF